MAERPLFIPAPDLPGLVDVMSLSFEWYPGFARSQKQKSIDAMHSVARFEGFAKPLEISSKAPNRLGVALSAFNLEVTIDGVTSSLESAFQSSKVFGGDRKMSDLFGKPPMQAKKDSRLTSSGPLEAFEIEGERWPLNPPTAFYDWLYITALVQHPDLAAKLTDYEAFTDIEFSPKRSINCQARSAALYVAMLRATVLEHAIRSRDTFLSVIDNTPTLGI